MTFENIFENGKFGTNRLRGYVINEAKKQKEKFINHTKKKKHTQKTCQAKVVLPNVKALLSDFVLHIF